MTKITKCKQIKGEKVCDFLAPLRRECEKYMGITAADGAENAFDTHLKTYFLQNRHKLISTEVKTCVGWETADLDMICSYACHVEKLEEEKKEQAARKGSHG